MKRTKRILLAFLTMLCLANPAFSAETSTPSVASELRAIIEQVQAKERGGDVTESNLTAQLQALDALVIKYKAEKSDVAAQILYTKARIYAEVLNDQKSYREVGKQILSDYPESKPAAALKRAEQAEKMRAQLVPGVVFPDFKQADVAGEPQSASKYKGKVLLIDFWATWCGPCVKEMPNVKQVYEKYHAQGFEVLGISFDSDLGKLKDYVAKNKIPWPQILDEKGTDAALGGRYGVVAIPSTFLIDREGKLIAKNVRGEALEPAVAGALAK